MNRIRACVSWRGVLAVAGLAALVSLTLTGCAAPSPIGAVEPTPTLYAAPPTHIPPPSPGPTPAALEFPLPAPTDADGEAADSENCIICHSAPALLQRMATAVEPKSTALRDEGWGLLPPLEEWEKVALDDPSFLETIHGRYGCITCHGGVGGTGDLDEAHQGLIRDPGVEKCGPCHPEQVATEPESLHARLRGYAAALAARSEPSKMAQLTVMLDNHCNTCHASCGQCHVSRPTNLGGGLVDAHQFKGVPPLDLTCTGCHGSRIEDEYMGQNAGVPADVHWVQGGMTCFDCHSAREMHGALGAPEYRYDGPPVPSCQASDCHPGVEPGDGIQQHTEVHLERISCQVCHSTTYKNCYNCHVGLENGNPYYKIDGSELAFKIGRNPLQSEDRPWTYVPVRHVPITRDSFAYYGESLLPNFDALPTWKYATPHNIQRITPQNETCGSCHGNTEVFLTDGDVSADELEANQDVIVEDLPFSMP
jgi:hypothetical protein